MLVPQRILLGVPAVVTVAEEVAIASTDASEEAARVLVGVAALPEEDTIVALVTGTFVPEDIAGPRVLTLMLGSLEWAIPVPENAGLPEASGWLPFVG